MFQTYSSSYVPPSLCMSSPQLFFFYPFEKSTAIGQSAFLSLSLPNTFSGRKKISPLIEEKCKSRVSVKGYKRHIVTKSFSDIIHCNIFSCYTCSSFLLTSQKQSSPNDIHWIYASIEWLHDDVMHIIRFTLLVSQWNQSDWLICLSRRILN